MTTPLPVASGHKTTNNRPYMCWCDTVAQTRRAETAEAELARLRAEIDALRNTTPPTA